MKKALGILAVIGSAAALVAYKLKKEEKKMDDLSLLEEEDISERILRSAESQNFKEEDFQQAPATETNSFPHLHEDDIMRLNAICEENFAVLETLKLDPTQERPLQHFVEFQSDVDLDNYKNKVIDEGYVVTIGEKEKELIVLNITLVTADDILKKVFHLADLAKQCNGNYNNWIIK